MRLLAMLGIVGATRHPLPGGGSVRIPDTYAPFAPSDNRYTETDSVCAYRRYHSTLAGTNESDGMIAVGLPSRYSDLETFVHHNRGMLTSRWSNANESQGRWYGKPEVFGETPATGPNGRELTGKLQVHTVGWTVYDAPGALYAVDDRRGVMIAVWILNRHGGERRARRLAERIAESFEA